MNLCFTLPLSAAAAETSKPPDKALLGVKMEPNGLVSPVGT